MRVWVLNPPFLPKFSRSQRSPAVTKSGTLYFPIWLAYGVGVLEEAGHEVTFTDAPARGISHEQTLQMAERIGPRLIVMDTSTPSIENDLGLATRLRSLLPNAFIVLVGTHVSALAGEALDLCPAVDAVARREYEFTLRDLAGQLGGASSVGAAPDLASVQGLSFRANGKVVHNPDRPYIEDLDSLPWVSRVYKRHLNIRDYFNPNAAYPMVTLMTGRGCPFRCSFCVYPQTFTGRRFRMRSVEDVVSEMEFVRKTFPEAKSIWLEDDTLAANKKRCLDLADALVRRGVRIPWEANSRTDLDLETMRRLKAAGCRELCVGFESAAQGTLDAIGKGTKVEAMRRFMSDASEAGLLIHGCFMVGFPGETEADVRKTLDLALELDPDTVQFYPVMVYPGTEAYEVYKEKGWLVRERYSEWVTPEGLHNCVVRNEFLGPDELVRYCDEGRRRFYLRPSYMARKVGQLIRHPGEIVRTVKASRVFFKYLWRGSRV